MPRLTVQITGDGNVDVEDGAPGATAIGPISVRRLSVGPGKALCGDRVCRRHGAIALLAWACRNPHRYMASRRKRPTRSLSEYGLLITGDEESLMAVAHRDRSSRDSRAPLSAIDRRNGLTLAEFEREYLYANKPVIIEDATQGWRALEHWSPEWLKQRYNSLPVVVDEVTYRFGDFIDRMMSPKDGEPTPYLRNQSIGNIFPELMADIQPSPYCFWPNWLHGRYVPEQLDDFMKVLTTLELFIGGRGSKFPSLHIDSAHTHAFLNQVYGSKDLILYAPSQSDLVYSNHKGISMIDNIDAPDLDKFPLFAEAVPIRVTIKAGDTILIPSGWWHTAMMPGPSITVSVNTANASNWADLVSDVSRQRGKVMGAGLSAYLTMMGVWNRIAGVGRRPKVS